MIEIATITYRSGPEWEERFGRRMLSEKDSTDDVDPTSGIPRLSPDFLIETYLDHQVSEPYHHSSTQPASSDQYRHPLTNARTGRTFLPNLRCQLHDLPLQSYGPIRHDLTSPYNPLQPIHHILPHPYPLSLTYLHTLILIWKYKTQTIHPNVQIPAPSRASRGFTEITQYTNAGIGRTE
jgi:hypothetical protein